MENVINTRTKSSLTLVLFAMLLSFQGIGQIWEHDNDGIHYFDSQQASENLSFYLFGDGHHSFEQNPTHDYGQASIGGPVHFRAAPYEDDEDPEEITMAPTTETSSNATNPDVEMDGGVYIKRSWNLVQDKKNFFVLSFQNKGEETISGCIEFYYNKNDLEILDSEILDDYQNNWVTSRDNETLNGNPLYTNKYTWDYNDLETGKQRHLYIKANCVPKAFSRVVTKAIMNIDSGTGCKFDAGTSEEHILESVVKSNPHDPNCIVATPRALMECDVEQTVSYRVYFHNDGTGPAQNVYIDMDVFAPIENAKLIFSPDKVDMFWSGPLVAGSVNASPTSPAQIRFVFPDIYLPGLNQPDPPGTIEETYGFVDFEICYDLAKFTEIDLDCSYMSAEIIFDDADPIRVENEICREIDCETGWLKREEFIGFESLNKCPLRSSPAHQSNYEIRTRANSNDKNLKSFEINPNPVSNILFIENIDLDQSGNIVIMDARGMKVRSMAISDLRGNNSLQIEDLNQGIYFLSITTDTERQTKRFVKQ